MKSLTFKPPQEIPALSLATLEARHCGYRICGAYVADENIVGLQVIHGTSAIVAEFPAEEWEKGAEYLRCAARAAGVSLPPRPVTNVTRHPSPWPPKP